MILMFPIQRLLQLNNVVTNIFCLSEVQSLRILSRCENVSNKFKTMLEKQMPTVFLIEEQ